MAGGKRTESGRPRALVRVLAGGLSLVAALVLAPLAPAGATTGGPADSGGTLTPTSFWMAVPGGTVYSFGHATNYGSAGGLPLAAPIVDLTPTGDGKGYWELGADGGIFAYGDAPFYGSPGGLALDEPIVGMAPTPDGKGYWLVAADGGIFAYGDAPFYGSTGGMALNHPIVGMAPTPDGKGYWLVASDGGVFAFGDAQFYGSTGGTALNRPIVGMAATPDGKGYWLVASDGGVFAFGDAQFYGSTGTAPTEPAEKIVAAGPSAAGEGYWIVDQNGTQYLFGPAATGYPPTQGVVFDPVTPGDKAVLFALLQLNKPYIWGGNGPAGYDCSGLALASWEQADGVSFARVADDQYHTAGSPVALASLQAGDLVFWGTKQTAWTTVYHTGIYIGGDQSVQATGDHVQLDQLGTYSPTGNLMPNGRRP